MTILEAIVQLRDDIKTWASYNFLRKVDKVSGKGLSTEDFTTDEKEQLAELYENQIVVDSALSSTSTNPVQNKVINSTLSNYVTKTYLTGDYLSTSAFTTAVSATVDASSMFHAGTSAPSNTNLLWIDTNSTSGGLKYYNGSSWVAVPVSYS